MELTIFISFLLLFSLGEELRIYLLLRAQNSEKLFLSLSKLFFNSGENFTKYFLKSDVAKYLRNNKAEVIKTANAKVNLPILNEKQEAELMDAIYEVVIDVVEGIKK